MMKVQLLSCQQHIVHLGTFAQYLERKGFGVDQNPFLDNFYEGKTVGIRC